MWAAAGQNAAGQRQHFHHEQRRHVETAADAGRHTASVPVSAAPDAQLALLRGAGLRKCSERRGTAAGHASSHPPRST